MSFIRILLLCPNIMIIILSCKNKKWVERALRCCLKSLQVGLLGNHSCGACDSFSLPPSTVTYPSKHRYFRFCTAAGRKSPCLDAETAQQSTAAQQLAQYGLIAGDTFLFQHRFSCQCIVSPRGERMIDTTEVILVGVATQLPLFRDAPLGLFRICDLLVPFTVTARLE